MSIKSDNFVYALNYDINEITLGKMVQKGSFKHAKWISDIDYTSYVRYNNTTINNLIYKIKNLNSFRFIKLNAGYIKEYIPPWELYPTGIRSPFKTELCNFDFNTALDWLYSIKKKLPINVYNNIYDILNKSALKIEDIVNIKKILDKYGKISWNKEDIFRKYKIINKIKYYLLEEIRNETSPVLKYIYIYYGKNENRYTYTLIDVGLVDNDYKKQMESPIYYYKNNWYKILKSLKKYIPKKIETQYWNDVSSLGYINSILSQIKLLKLIIEYNIFNKEIYEYLQYIIDQDLFAINIRKKCTSDELNDILQNKLNEYSIPLVYKYLPLLKNNESIHDKNFQIFISYLSRIPTDIKTIVNRRNDGILCPFFDYTKITDVIAYKTNININKMSKCVDIILNKYKDTDLEDMFEYMPVQRLYMYDNNEKKILHIYGEFDNTDKIFFNLYGSYNDNLKIYEIPIKYIKQIQIYFITGKIYKK